MDIVYRSNRGSFVDSMKTLKKFSSLKELFEYVISEHECAFLASNIFISYYSYDDRILRDVYAVCVSRYFDEDYLKKYHSPQIIGFVWFDNIIV